MKDESTIYSLRGIKDLEPGDHLCCLYGTEEEHQAVVMPFLRQGLERGEKVVYIVDAHTAETILGYLRGDGLEVEPYLASGQLVILTRDDAYLREGVFDPDGMIALLRAETEQALAEGYPALRVTGEITWALRGLPGSERLIEYEAKLNEFFPGSQCLAICQYDRRRFDPEVLLDVLRTHPIAILGKEVYDNFYYIPPDELLGGDLPAVELGHWLENLAERKRAEDALRESKQLLEKTFASLLDAVFFIDADTVEIMDCNPAASEIFGYGRQEMLGRTTAFLHVDQVALEEFRQRLYPAVAEKGFLFLPEFRMKRKDGTVFPTEHSVMPLEGERGQRIGWVSVVRDITERKRAEEALRESEERFRRLSEASFEGIMIHEEGRVIDANRAFAAMFSYDLSELIGMNALDFATPELREVATEHMRTRSEEPYEGVAMRRDGSTFAVEVQGKNIPYKGRTVRVIAVRDITERKRAEEELIRLSSAVKTSVDSIVIIDVEGKILEVNEAALKLYGTDDKRDLIGQDILDSIAPEQRERALAGIEFVLEKGYDTSVGYEAITKDGRRIPLDLSATVMKDADGKPIGIVIIGRDITERKQAEEALQESEKKYRTLFENMAQGAFYQRADGVLVDGNLAVLEMFGLTRDQFLARTSMDPRWKVIHEDGSDFPGEQHPSMEALQTGKPVRGVVAGVFNPRKEDYVWLSINAIPQFKAGEDRPYQVFVTLHDITDRKRAEEALREAEKRYRDLYDNAPVMYHTIDTKGIVLECNQTEADMLGYSKEEIIGQPIYAFETKEYQDLAPHALREGMEKGHAVGERRFVRKDGTIIDAALDATAIYDDSGQVVGFRATFTDITERKRAEEALQHSLEETAHGQRTLLALSQAARAVQRAHTPDDVYRTITDQIAGLGYQPTIFTLTDDGEHMSVSHMTFQPALLRSAEQLSGLSVRDFRFPLAPHGLFQPIIAEGQTLFFERTADLMVRGMPKRVRPLVERLVAMMGIERSVYAPLTVGNKTQQVLAVMGTDLTEADVPAVSAFANQAAIAIENARLYEETRRHALEQETVSRIAYALNTPDVRDAFLVLVEGLQDLTGCDMVSLIAMDEAGEQCIMSVLESPFPIPGEGDAMPLSATAAAEDIGAGHPHLTADLSTEAHFPLEQALYQAGLRSQVTLPLLVGDEVFGALNLGGSHTGLFREDQLPVLQQIADAVALALENSFLFQVEREQRELAEALEEAAATVSSTLDLDEVLDRILEQAEWVVAGEAFSVILIEDEAARVVRWRGYELPGEETLPSRFDIPINNYSTLMKMAQMGKPVVVADTSLDPDWIPTARDQAGWRRSYVGAPIRLGGATVGFLSASGSRPGQFGPEDARRMEALASHAAAAIGNARLYEELQRKVEELELLLDVATAVSSTLDVDYILRTLAEKMTTSVGATFCRIALLDEMNQTLTIRAAFAAHDLDWDQGLGRQYALADAPWHRQVIERRDIVILRQDDAPKAVSETECRIALSKGVQSAVLIPLVIGERALGVVSLGEMRSWERSPLTADRVRLCQALANQAAIAIENARLFEQVQAGRERLGWLTQQVVSAQEDERHRLSRELHDEAGQSLTALRISLDLIRDDLPLEAGPLRQRLGQVTALAETTMEHIRLLAQNLRPPGLDTVGLNLTLEGLCREFAERTQLPVDYVGTDLPLLPQGADICLYRFLQEALTNVAKHAHANRVWVALRSDAETVALSVEDDGQGFEVQAGMSKGIGLLGMEERIELLGGQLEIESQPGQGTCLTARVPLEKPYLERRQAPDLRGLTRPRRSNHPEEGSR